jgi:hypothetical protein
MVKITHLGHKITSLKFQLTEKDNIIHREVMSESIIDFLMPNSERD